MAISTIQRSRSDAREEAFAMEHEALGLESLTAARGGADLKRAYGCAPSGVAAIAAVVDGRPSGMLVSSLTSVSIDPPLLSICVQNTSRTWADLREADSIGVSVLGDTYEPLCGQLAGPWATRFAGVTHATTDRGAVLLPDASAWFVCSVHDEFAAGDHVIALLRIEELSAQPKTRPLIFHGSRYRRLVA